MAVLVLVPALLFGGGPRLPADGGDPAVPQTVELPWMWQATVQQDPRGPASMLFSGTGLGLRGHDLIDHEGKVAVVGRDGSYRMLLYGGAESVAGESAILSPDGRYVAHDHLGELFAPSGYLLVTDLMTGKTKVYRGPEGATCCAVPVAWRPDGGAVLVLDPAREPVRFDAAGNGVQPVRLMQIELASGAALHLDDIGDRWKSRSASHAAYSPDGQRIAASVGTQLRLFDTAGTALWTAELGPGRYLAGPGAFTADGRRLATVTLDGCLDDCDEAALGARRWSVSYLDAATGAEADGPALAPVTAMAVRALGWRHGTDLVAVTYRPEPGGHKRAGDPWWSDTGFWQVGDASLVALNPGSGIESLLDPPDEVRSMDVARDLLEAGRFGGPATRPAPFPAREVILVPVVLFSGPVVAVTGGLVAWLVRRRRRRAFSSPAARHG